MRIAYGHTGSDVYDRLFLESLSQEHQVSLLTFSSRPTQVPSGVTVVRMPDLGWPVEHRDLDRLRIALAQGPRAVTFKRYVERVNPDILIGNYISTYGLYSAFSNWHPFALFAYGSDIVEEPRISPFHRWLAKYVVSKADLILVDSDIQERAALRLGAEPGNIMKFPWFNLSECDHVTKDVRFRKMLGWSEKTVVVCVRMHEKHYKIDTVLRAVPLVLKEDQNVRFLLCGTGSQTSRLKATAKDFGVEDSVYFAGLLPRRQVVAVVKGCDIYVSPSQTDGTSASLLEAMSAGLPCLVTDIPGNKEWIKDEKNGLLFQVGDHEALASLILRLSTDNKLRVLLGESAALSIRLKINWQRDFARLLGRLTAMNGSQRTVPPNRV